MSTQMKGLNTREGGLTLNIPTFIAALKSCNINKDIQTGRNIHSHLVEAGFDKNIYVANATMDMYAKCGYMEEALRIFHGMQERSVVSWNTIVLGYARNQQGELGLEVFKHMQEQGFFPDSWTYVAALKACASLIETPEGVSKVKLAREKTRDIHMQILKSKHCLNIMVNDALVNLYINLESLQEAIETFNRMPQKTIFAWNSIIKGYARNEKPELALVLFSEMQRTLEADGRTYLTALEACVGVAKKEQGAKLRGKLVKLIGLENTMAIHSQAIETGYASDVYVSNCLIDTYVKCGSIEDGIQVFNGIPNRDVVSWNIMISSAAQCGKAELALHLFECMQVSNPCVDARTFLAALKACICIAPTEAHTCLEKVLALHSLARNMLHKMDSFLMNMLMDAYIKCGSIIDARCVFDGMLNKSIVTWNTIIMGYAEHGNPKVSLELFERMQKEGLKPDGTTYVAALKACGALSALETGRAIHECIRKEVSDDTILATALINFYGKCGSMKEAQEVFECIRKKDPVAWGALLAGYSNTGDINKVFEVFNNIKKERVNIDGISILHVLTACSQAGLVEKGMEVFNEMVQTYSVEPRIEHYTCMVDLLGRSNRLEEALALIRRMPCEADSAIWTSVLCACRKWRNAEVGKLAFDEIMRLDGSDPGVYALMAGTYSASLCAKRESCT